MSLPSTVPLSSLVMFMKNGTTADQNLEGRGLPVTRIETIADGSINLSRVRHVELDDEDASKWSLAPGDILLSHINSVEHIGKSAIYRGIPNRLIHGMNLLLLRPNQNVVLPEFLLFGLRSAGVRAKIKSRCKQAVNQASINQKELGQIELTLPKLDEQHRIVDLLSRAESIFRLRREAQQKAAELVPAIFLEMFGDPVSNPKGWPIVPLSQVADVQGGLQVTTKRASLPLEAPYLRVANVYRSRLDLREIKSIRLTVAELQRTRLEVGDLLFVEGHGNPQEVGRCAVWDGSIDGCTHQNHLIRARPDETKLVPEFACASLNSVSGRRTLVDTGKTTSGLSTISAQNVKQAKLMLPPLSLQELFKQRANDAGSIAAQQVAATEKAQSVFNALLAQAFE